mmetsp:Transcript_103311/g.267170  ORF Transcript_103311/g.267170 Transcript_103311/m.267170 type:complete len:215 (-) Transcript_103311:63-707(-)
MATLLRRGLGRLAGAGQVAEALQVLDSGQRLASSAMRPCAGLSNQGFGGILCAAMQQRGFAAARIFGFPPEKARHRYSGIHCHPDKAFGYKHPQKRQGDAKRLPNVRLKPYDFELSHSADGQFYWRTPYPPRVNRTIEVTPPWGARKNPWPTHEHKNYVMRWRNIEYVHVPQLTRKPHGQGRQRWAGPVTRVEHLPNGKKSATMITHDKRLLEI